MAVAVENMTSFTGVLVRRQYRPGQKYVQLVFDTATGVRLSLTQNLPDAKRLSIGQCYAVRGQECRVGHKTYIHEPLMKPASAARPGFLSRNQRFVVVAVVFVVGMGGVGTAALAWRHVTTQQQAYARTIDAEANQAAETAGIANKITNPAKANRSAVAPPTLPTPQPVVAPFQSVTPTSQPIVVRPTPVIAEADPQSEVAPTPPPAPAPQSVPDEILPAIVAPADLPVSVAPDTPIDPAPTFPTPAPTTVPPAGDPVPVAPTEIL